MATCAGFHPTRMRALSERGRSAACGGTLVAAFECMATLKDSSVAGTNDEAKRLLALTRTFETAMLVTHSSSGESRARPMAIADVTESGEVWFVTGADATKVDEIKHDEHVLVVMQSSNAYLSISGHARTRKDPALVQKLWKESWRVWFKDKLDPNILLIQVTPIEGEYWDQSGTKGVKYLVRAATAYVSGKPMGGSDVDSDQHGKVRL
jgi:general stress protein 26